MNSVYSAQAAGKPDSEEKMAVAQLLQPKSIQGKPRRPGTPRPQEICSFHIQAEFIKAENPPVKRQ